MYTSFFGLNEKPFSITPDPRYLFMSARHGEALAHLVYGVTESGGFMQLTGEVGTGKTTLVRTLLANRMPDNADVAVILNPQLSPLEFLEAICEELGIGDERLAGSSKALIDTLNQHLLKSHAAGRRTILIVDEAQNLARDVLEQVRLLTNLETAKQKLLQIILIGQPELRELLARNDLRQLAQRITGRYHLEPLMRDETAAYIDHRLRVAGAVGEVFDSAAKKEAYRLSQGVPRLINVICDRALLGAYGAESRRVTRGMVRRAAAEIAGTTYRAPWLRWVAPAMVTAGVLLLAYGVWSVLPPSLGDGPAGAPSAQAASSVAETTLAASAPDDAVAAGRIDAPAGVVDEPAAAPAQPAGPSLDEQLRLAAGLTGQEAALKTLFALWGLDIGDAADACAEAANRGYECLTQRGSWNSLRQFDRPAVLTLTDSAGAQHRVVLTAIRGDRVELSVAGVDVSHDVDDLTEFWFGQYLLLWKPVYGRAIALIPGSRNRSVVWLRQSLAAIDDRYRAEPLTSDVYDATLETRVRDFQRDHRLLVDGLAGQQTQILINSLLEPDSTPRLEATPLLAKD